MCIRDSIQLAEAHLERKDTNKAVQMLAKVSSIDINDKALVALEKQDQLLVAKKNYEAAKKVKRQYITALDKRIKEIKGINLRYSVKKYQTKKEEVQIAIKNLSANPTFSSPSINTTISQQPPKPPVLNTTPLITKYITLVPQNSNGKPVGLYKVKIPNQRTTVTRNRTFKIPCNNWQCIGEKVTISAEGYLPKKIVLSKSDRPIKVKLEKIVTPN